MATRLPCTGHSHLYDAILWPDDNTTASPAAIAQAAALCSRCPAPCEQKITTDSKPRPLVLLDYDWMPPAHDGVPDPTPRRDRQPTTQRSRDHARPEERVTVWAQMAAQRAAQGESLPDIADWLCVTQDTAQRLLDLRQRGAAA